MTKQEKESFINQLIDEVKREVWLWKDYNYFLDDLQDYVNIDNLEDVEYKDDFLEEVENLIDEFIRDQELIYHNESLDFLKFNDLDFSISISEAKELGFNMVDLNPGLLATLALQYILRDEIFYILNRLKEETSNE